MSDGELSVGLLGPVEVRHLAEKLGVRPTKTLGQNFVHDHNTVRNIVQRAGVTHEDHVVEVGPGLGSLTLELAQRAGSVTAIEIDPRLAAQVHTTVTARVPRAAPLEVIVSDAMQVRELTTAPTVLVANLPYNVSVPVLLHLLATFPSIDRGLVMVQAEVADRLSAPPGSRTYGVPSVKAAWFADMHRDITISRNVFWPVPNVDSALVGFTRHAEPLSTVSRRQVFAVVDAAFAQRRKMLRAALATWAGSSTAAATILTNAGVDPTARGETLCVNDFVRIAEAGHRAGVGSCGAAHADTDVAHLDPHSDKTTP